MALAKHELPLASLHSIPSQRSIPVLTNSRGSPGPRLGVDSHHECCRGPCGGAWDVQEGVAKDRGGGTKQDEERSHPLRSRAAW